MARKITKRKTIDFEKRVIEMADERILSIPGVRSLTGYLEYLVIEDYNKNKKGKVLKSPR